jgi:RsiW-degrading membrane proteinase PrsW (M82 family)
MSGQPLDIQQLLSMFLSIFLNANIWGILLAILFCAIWLALFKPALIKKPWLWAVLVGSGIVGAAALVFIQIPLQNWIGISMLDTWGSDRLTATMLLSAIPTLLISGLVQEGAKLIPVVIYWWRSSRNIDQKFGLALGAVAGAGFGIMEAQWILSTALNQGWNLDYTITYGLFMGISPLWERFFTVAFHIGVTAIAAYGLANGLGWIYYAVASVLHVVLNYSVILLSAKVFSIVAVEIYIAILALVVIGWAVLIHRKVTATKKAAE